MTAVWIALLAMVNLMWALATHELRKRNRRQREWIDEMVAQKDRLRVVNKWPYR